MRQHLRVRNEIWSFPLSEEHLAAIDRGEGAPFDPHIELWRARRPVHSVQE